MHFLRVQRVQTQSAEAAAAKEEVRKALRHLEALRRLGISLQLPKAPQAGAIPRFFGSVSVKA